MLRKKLKIEHNQEFFSFNKNCNLVKIEVFMKMLIML